jgi:hypothetical protein
MFPPIPVTPRCAARCSSRIDLIPSRRLGVAWVVWLFLACAVILLAVDLPLWVRIGICLAIAAANMFALRSFVFLRGAAAVRALDWSEAGKLNAMVGANPAPMLVELASGSFRLGVWLVVLRLRGPSKVYSVLIDGSVQSRHAFRRLCGHLKLPPRGTSRR